MIISIGTPSVKVNLWSPVVTCSCLSGLSSSDWSLDRTIYQADRDY